MLTRVWHDWVLDLDEAQPLLEIADVERVPDELLCTAFAHSQLCRGAIDCPWDDDDDDEHYRLPDDVRAYSCAPCDLALVRLQTTGFITFLFVRDDLVSIVSDGRIWPVGADYPLTY